MDVRVGDVLELKKAHPCGSKSWLVLPRTKAEKAIKKIQRTQEKEENT